MVAEIRDPKEGTGKGAGGGQPRQNSEGQNHRSGAGCSGRRSGHVGGIQDGNNSGGGGAQGGNGNNADLPPPPPGQT